MSCYVVCGSKSWNKRIFDEKISKLPGVWRYIGTKVELTFDFLHNINPKYVFFLHWSWKVPKNITDVFECINFHMTDVPYGRGGSPLQNLILRGHTETKLSALKMVEEMDAGPVYLKKTMSLEGDAQEILDRSSVLAASMIEEIIQRDPEPKPQKGEVVEFVRRSPEESRIPEGLTDEELYDFIRMLDGEGYPRAFKEENGIRYEFYDAVRHNGRTEAKCNQFPIVP